jgi:hypothetical protein
MALLPHQIRVVAEKGELDERLHRLVAFMVTATFAELPEAEQARLTRQRDLMAQLSMVLGERIAAFSA